MAKSDDITPENPRDDKALPVGASVRVARLDDLRRVRAEISRLYREARRREGRYPDAITAMRLANVLGHVRTAIEVDELRARLDALEHQVGSTDA
jgi:hypothetical protein